MGWEEIYKSGTFYASSHICSVCGYQNASTKDFGDKKNFRNCKEIAIYDGHYSVVQFLVEHGIDIAAYYAIGELDKVDACGYAK